MVGTMGRMKLCVELVYLKVGILEAEAVVARGV
jgi:hypothetical protein